MDIGPKIHTFGGHYFGFCNLSIGYIWQNLPEFFEGFGITVTCIDSTERVSSSPTIKNRIAQGWHLAAIGTNAIYVPNYELSKFLEDKSMLCGFDECYLSKNKPVAITLSEGHFTTDGFQFDVKMPHNFLERFHSLNAVRYLSDGLGLNFVTENLELTKKVVDLSLREQGSA